MTEIGARGLEACLSEASGIAMDECDGVFLSVDIDVCDPGHAPGSGRFSRTARIPPALEHQVARCCASAPATRGRPGGRPGALYEAAGTAAVPGTVPETGRAPAGGPGAVRRSGPIAGI